MMMAGREASTQFWRGALLALFWSSCGGGIVAAQIVTIVSVNDVYKLTGLSSELPYFYMKEDLAYVNGTAAARCDGELCGPGSLGECGKGGAWESCFPLAFDRVRELSLTRPPADGGGVRVAPGPCGSGGQGSSPQEEPEERKYGGLVDFGATFRWLKDEATAAGALAIGTLAGDFIAPSYLAEMFRGKQLVEIMNHMGVDLVDIGNHDVDFKLPNLKEQMNKSAFHYLNSNIADEKGDEIQQPMISDTQIEGNVGTYAASEWRHLHTLAGSRFGNGWAMLNRSGVAVCVLGTTDIDKMNWPGKKIKGFERDIPAAIAILEQWEKEQLGCTLKIAMTHTRTGNDLNLFRAAELRGLHLDAIIAGHDHYALFAELTRGDGGVTYLVKAGADARAISKLTFDLSGERPAGTLEVVPVVSGSCKHHLKDSGRQAWFSKGQDLFARYVSKADEADALPINVLYHGLYDTTIVRDAESRAVNMWLDFMRTSVSADVLFFQAGVVRQDMYQDFVRGVALSQLFMLEEFPWGDEDTDSRSSLFPFKVSVEDLVLRTLPFVARKYWCRAPFNDANRMHVSGLILEMVNEDGCASPAAGNPIQSVTFVGDCHQKGALQTVDDRCCSSPLCGRLWTDGGWDPRVTKAMQLSELLVVTGQVCVPSKFGSHGEGFHSVGMLCKGAEAPENWGSGAAFAQQFQGRGVLDGHDFPSASADFQRFGIFLKPAMLAMLRKEPEPVVVGIEGAKECQAAAQWYSAETFSRHCLCEMRASDAKPCTTLGRRNGFPRFHAAPASAFPRGQDANGEACPAGSEAECRKVSME